jgi:hypothetical protein
LVTGKKEKKKKQVQSSRSYKRKIIKTGKSAATKNDQVQQKVKKKKTSWFLPTAYTNVSIKEERRNFRGISAFPNAKQPYFRYSRCTWVKYTRLGVHLFTIPSFEQIAC